METLGGDYQRFAHDIHDAESSTDLAHEQEIPAVERGEIKPEDFVTMVNLIKDGFAISLVLNNDYSPDAKITQKEISPGVWATLADDKIVKLSRTQN
jgi:hypothetical protein